MSNRPVTDGGDGGPDWRLAAIRCGLEVTLFSLSALYLYLHVGSHLLRGILLVVGILESVAILLWYVDRLSLAWVKYARSLTDRKRRKRERQRRQRRRERPENDR